MIASSISVEGVAGLTWPSWKRLVSVIPQLGFAGIFCSDHFVPPAPAYPDSLELMMALGYFADHTSGIHFGSLVSPLSFRDPVMLTRQAIALDTLSDGRMILGLGAGWNEREHAMFGYRLGDMATRFARFADGLAVITRLLEHNEPVSYSGPFFQLQDALLQPRPARAGGLPILIGGNGPRRTLPLVARYAAIWNASSLPPDVFRERSRLLDDLLHREGRRPEDVRRTVTITALCGRTPQELEQRVAWFRKGSPEFAAMPLEAVLNIFRGMFQAMVVTPEELIHTMDDYAAAGADEIMLQWFGVDDIEGLELLAEHVLPYVRS
jgi:alkanesulfonate monooxygenase SsuD/methylene tetrahydromethanopterin reductase-like flavin-dependent oxidoreductase (luciferase family)